MAFADLHIHTNKSDSTFSPEEVVKYAAKAGLDAIAITDHDSVAAIPLVQEYALNYNIEVIPGIEFSSDLDGEEVHILGYFIDNTNSWFLEKLKFLQETRIKRAMQIIEKLNELHIDINMKDILNISGDGAIGRMHIARALMNKKYVRSIPDAFQKYIGKGKYAYVTKYRITPKEAIEIIKQLNGISVLAHPQLMNNDAIILKLIQQGIQGIEVYHSDHTAKGTKKYLALATKHNLHITGGSDCHGIGKGKILIGTIKIPYELVQKLKDAIRNRDINV